MPQFITEAQTLCNELQACFCPIYVEQLVPIIREQWVTNLSLFCLVQGKYEIKVRTSFPVLSATPFNIHFTGQI